MQKKTRHPLYFDLVQLRISLLIGFEFTYHETGKADLNFEVLFEVRRLIGNPYPENVL